MNLKKTKQSERGTYKFDLQTTDVLPENVILIPGKDGVTEEDIAWLHRADDRDVESDKKEIIPEYSLTKSELKARRAKKREYEAKWSREFREMHGYEPNNMLIRGAVKDEFAADWTFSLDGLIDGDSETEGFGDKTMFLAGYDNYQLRMDEGYRSPEERLSEIVDQLTERQQLIYREVMLEHKTRISVAAKIGISNVMVAREERKIKKLLEEDEILKKFFR